MADGDDSLRVYGHEDPAEPYDASTYSRTGIEMWEANGHRWFEQHSFGVSPVAISLDEKAALGCNTGHWPSNERNWRKLPRWQRAQVKPA